MSEAIEKFVSVPFMGTEIQATSDEKHYVALKPLVEGIGLDWRSIRKLVKRSALNSTVVMMTTVAEDGKNREMVCLPLDRLNGLLFLITPNDYNHNPALKERLVNYQKMCYDALYQYFNNGVAVHPVMAMQPQEVQMQAFQKAINDAVSNALDMARAQMTQMSAEFKRTKAWISEKREATACQRNSVLTRKLNDAIKERDEAEFIAEQKQKYVDYLQGRLSRWGRPRRNDPRYYAEFEEIDLF